MSNINNLIFVGVKSQESTIHREFNKHGTLVAEGKFENGLQQGVWREYYDSGELAIMQCYHNGQPHGRFTSYHLNGSIWSEGTHVFGRCEGTFRVYDEEGNLIREMLYKEGELIQDKNLRSTSKTYFE
jgi:antitoxin component YwqK of YwqJK toxin-antitoxin module